MQSKRISARRLNLGRLTRRWALELVSIILSIRVWAKSFVSRSKSFAKYKKFRFVTWRALITFRDGEEKKRKVVDLLMIWTRPYRRYIIIEFTVVDPHLPNDKSTAVTQYTAMGNQLFPLSISPRVWDEFGMIKTLLTFGEFIPVHEGHTKDFHWSSHPL